MKTKGVMIKTIIKIIIKGVIKTKEDHSLFWTDVKENKEKEHSQ